MELKIGILTLQSKAVPKMSKSFMNGLRLALKKTNLDIKYFVEGVGNGTEIDAVAEKVEKLVMQEDVDIIVGMTGHRSIPRLQALADSMWVPMIISGYGAAMPADRGYSDAFLSLSLDRWHSTYLLGQYLVKNVSNSVGVAASYYDGGYGMIEGLGRGLFKADGNFAGHYIVPHTPRENESEFFIEAVSDLEEKPLVTVHSGLFAMEFAESMKALGDKQTFPMFTTPETVSEEVLSEYGEYYLGTKVVTTWAKELDNEANREFITALKDKKKEPDEFALLGYETGLVINVALKDIDADDLDEDIFIDALNKVKTEGPRGEISFDNELNHAVHNHHIFEVVKTNGQCALSYLESLEADVDYIIEASTEEESRKRGGWFNAYLCH